MDSRRGKQSGRQSGSSQSSGSSRQSSLSSARSSASPDDNVDMDTVLSDVQNRLNSQGALLEQMGKTFQGQEDRLVTRLDRERDTMVDQMKMSMMEVLNGLIADRTPTPDLGRSQSLSSRPIGRVSIPSEIVKSNGQDKPSTSTSRPDSRSRNPRSRRYDQPSRDVEENDPTRDQSIETMVDIINRIEKMNTVKTEEPSGISSKEFKILTENSQSDLKNSLRQLEEKIVQKILNQSNKEIRDSTRDMKRNLDTTRDGVKNDLSHVQDNLIQQINSQSNNSFRELREDMKRNLDSMREMKAEMSKEFRNVSFLLRVLVFMIPVCLLLMSQVHLLTGGKKNASPDSSVWSSLNVDPMDQCQHIGDLISASKDEMEKMSKLLMQTSSDLTWRFSMEDELKLDEKKKEDVLLNRLNTSIAKQDNTTNELITIRRKLYGIVDETIQLKEKMDKLDILQDVSELKKEAFSMFSKFMEKNRNEAFSDFEKQLQNFQNDIVGSVSNHMKIQIGTFEGRVTNVIGMSHDQIVRRLSEKQDTVFAAFDFRMKQKFNESKYKIPNTNADWSEEGSGSLSDKLSEIHALLITSTGGILKKVAESTQSLLGIEEEVANTLQTDFDKQLQNLYRDLSEVIEKEGQLARDMILKPKQTPRTVYEFFFPVRLFDMRLKSGVWVISCPWYVQQLDTSLRGNVKFNSDGGIHAWLIYGRYPKRVGLTPRPQRQFKYRVSVVDEYNKDNEMLLGESTTTRAVLDETGQVIGYDGLGIVDGWLLRVNDLRNGRFVKKNSFVIRYVIVV